MYGLPQYILAAQMLNLGRRYLEALTVVVFPWVLLLEQPAVRAEMLEWGEKNEPS